MGAENNTVMVGEGSASLTIALSDVQAVTFFKNKFLGPDLICCEINIGKPPNVLLTETVPGWSDLIAALKRLPGFDLNWHEKVAKAAFAKRTVAFKKSR